MTEIINNETVVHATLQQNTPMAGSTVPGGITRETDPTVPDWAKQPSKGR